LRSIASTMVTAAASGVVIGSFEAALDEVEPGIATPESDVISVASPPGITELTPTPVARSSVHRNGPPERLVWTLARGSGVVSPCPVPANPLTTAPHPP
jgi:hypothetical protein